MTNNDVDQPTGVSQANYAIAEAIVTDYTHGETSVVSVDWAIYQIALARQTRTPADVQERARQAASAILSNISVNEFRQAQDYDRWQRVAAIIATEFGSGVK